MKTFKKFLVEATDASTYFEGVIALCVSMYGNGKKAAEKSFKDKILKQTIVKQFLKKTKKNWAVYGKKPKEQKEILWKFAKLVKEKTKATTADAGAGQSKVQVSDWWGKTADKQKDTSKTDITIGTYKVSVKGPKAQLMSGEQKESRATVLSAMKASGVGGKLEQELLGEVDKFVTITRTIGADLTGGELKKMSVDDVKKYKDFDPSNFDFKGKKLLKKEKIEKLIKSNLAAKKIIDKQDKMKMSIQRIFENALKTPAVATAFAYESMTGKEKFGGKGGTKSGRANYILVWDYNLTNLKFKPITQKYAVGIGSQMSVKPDMKSGHYSKKINGKDQKLGYSFYQSLRLSVDIAFKKSDSLRESFYNDIEIKQRLLSEGLIDLDKIKEWFAKAWKKFTEGIKKIWNWLAEKIAEIKDAAVEMIQDGIESALNLFELDLNVKVNPVVTL